MRYDLFLMGERQIDVWIGSSTRKKKRIWNIKNKFKDTNTSLERDRKEGKHTQNEF